MVGVDDPHLKYDRYDRVAGPADPSAALTVGVTHAPYTRVLDAMTADGAGLVIAGHTHGGQLCLPFYGALVTNCDLDRGRAKGVSRWWPGAGAAPSSEAPEGAAWLEVSAGLGTSPYAPVRFACRPEATLLTLTGR
jgi:predicted MPP superfamily phosphohydrolase